MYLLRYLIILFTALTLIVLASSCKTKNNNDKQFELLNTSLLNNLEDIQYETNDIYEKIVKNTLDITKRERALNYFPIAEKVRKYSSEAIVFLDSIYLLVKNQPNYKLSDSTIVDIYSTLQLFRIRLLNNIPDQSIVFRDNTTISKTLFDSIYYHKATFANDFFAIRSNQAIKATLSGFESIIKQSEKELLNYCYWNTEPIRESYNQFSYIISQSSTIVRSGEEIEIIAGVGSFSRAAQPKITIAGKYIETNEAAVSTYKFKAGNKPGQYYIPVRIEYTKPDGTKDTVSNEIKYTISKIGDLE